jgi:AcrR family transcriptional regulator
VEERPVASVLVKAKAAALGEARAPKQSRSEATRARLFAAAVRSFSTRGYVETTVERIARAARVAKGTFFIHFATKDAVIAELVLMQIRYARGERDRVLEAGGSPVDALRVTVFALAERVAANRELGRAVITANILSTDLGGFAAVEFAALRATMADDARAAQKARLLDPGLDPAHVAETLMTSYWGAILHHATAPSPQRLLDILGPVVASNLEGFGAPTGGAGRRRRAKGSIPSPGNRR